MGIVNARILARRDTTANWNAHRDFIPLRGEMIVYEDYGSTEDGYGNRINVPGIKIGDGRAYLIDLPFAGNEVSHQILAELRAHTGDAGIHVTAAEKDGWNNKLNCTIRDGNLTLNRD